VVLISFIRVQFTKEKKCMQYRYEKLVILTFLISAILLSSCGSTIETVEVTREVPQTVLVTEVVVVTATSPPSTNTPVPTNTPEPTPTPRFNKWTASEAADYIIQQGLEFESPRPMTPDDYGFAPMVADEAIRFLLPSLCSDCGGRLFSFTSEEDLEKTKSYYTDLAEESALFFSWVFSEDNILIQMNGDLSESKAVQYKEVLENLGE
jgi:predicted small secreted protein